MIDNSNIKSIGKNQKLIAIVGLIFIGLFLLVSIIAVVFSKDFSGEIMENMKDVLEKQGINNSMASLLDSGASIFAGIMLLFLAIMFIPVFFLFKSGTNLNTFSFSQDQFHLAQGFKNFKVYLLISIIFSCLGLLGSVIGLFA